jgi:hypothetical protein
MQIISLFELKDDLSSARFPFRCASSTYSSRSYQSRCIFLQTKTYPRIQNSEITDTHSTGISGLSLMKTLIRFHRQIPRWIVPGALFHHLGSSGYRA